MPSRPSGKQGGARRVADHRGYRLQEMGRTALFAWRTKPVKSAYVHKSFSGNPGEIPPYVPLLMLIVSAVVADATERAC